MANKLVRELSALAGVPGEVYLNRTASVFDFIGVEVGKPGALASWSYLINSTAKFRWVVQEVLEASKAASLQGTGQKANASLVH